MIAWFRRRRVIREAAKRDEYIERLQNSVSGLCGLSHFGDPPFLEIGEVRRLISEELDRAVAAAPTPDEGEIHD